MCIHIYILWLKAGTVEEDDDNLASLEMNIHEHTTCICRYNDFVLRGKSLTHQLMAGIVEEEDDNPTSKICNGELRHCLLAIKDTRKTITTQVSESDLN